MPPKETTALVNGRASKPSTFSFVSDESPADVMVGRRRRKTTVIIATLVAAIMVIAAVCRHDTFLSEREPTGPYTLVQRQVGQDFFSFYNFYEGPDTLGSAGYNTYVSQRRASDLDLVRIDQESGDVIIQSAPTNAGPRESVRLEGKRRFSRGLFILEVSHVPAGCGVWPAFWLTDDDEGKWPGHGEIDIVEGVNTLTTAKTALHTSESCSMYAHVPSWSHTGVWDRASGIPDTWTGALDTNTSVPADNCWNMAAHQWANQGCVVAETRQNTIGAGFNDNGGGVYALEWDPLNGYIKSWVWTQDEIPANLKDAISHEQGGVDPDPSSWNVPYAYFAIGKDSGCSADHFQNHRIVINMAFCGSVAGNRFLMDCPSLSNWTGGQGDPIEACNAYIRSDPSVLNEAYWRIQGLHVYKRSMQNVKRTAETNHTST